MPPAERTAVAGQTFSILFVRGQERDINILNRSIMNAAESLYTAENGSEALELLRKERPCLVIAAVALGDMTGFELCARAREADCGAAVVLIGREKGESAYCQAMEAGAARYLLLDEAAAGLEAVIADCRRLSFAGHERAAQSIAFRRQAEILSALPAPVALIASGGAVSFANRAFMQLTGFNEGSSGVPLAALLNSLPTAEPDNGWAPLLEAAMAGREWSGRITCREELNKTVFIRASLTRFAPSNELAQATGTPDAASLLLTINDLTGEYEQLTQLAIQRDSAFELLESQRTSEISIQNALPELSLLFAGGQDDAAPGVLRRLRSFAAGARDMNHVARLLAGEASAAVEQFSLRAVIESVRTSLSGQFKNRNRGLRVDIPPYIPDLCRGDQAALRFALSSLLTGALESCGSDGATLTADVKEKSSSGLTIQFSVDFNHNGVPFNSFESMCGYLGREGYQGTPGNWPQRTGLSLATALIGRLGGKIWVRSTAGQGRSFCFTIGLAESAQPETAAPEQEIRHGAGQGSAPAEAAFTPSARILLAEDSVIDQLAIRKLLENRGCQVTCVSNGREAVDEFDRASYDAVLMDILMPEMDGFEATRLIREKERLLGNHTPIIALTAYSLKAVQDKCAAAGMDSYLPKPLSSKELEKLSAAILRPVDSSLAAPPVSEAPLLDIQETIANLGDNENLYREIVALFRENAPGIHAGLLDAVRAGKHKEIETLAHKLKGMSSNIGAKRFAELTGRIQDSSLAGGLTDSPAWLDSLTIEFQRLQDALATLAPQ